MFLRRCAECTGISLCSDCFATGIKIGDHEPWHAYRVSDCLDIPYNGKDWSYNEELLLLQGIERCGLGNWRGISEHINQAIATGGVGGSHKSHKEVEAHYWEMIQQPHPSSSSSIKSETPSAVCCMHYLPHKIWVNGEVQSLGEVLQGQVPALCARCQANLPVEYTGEEVRAKRSRHAEYLLPPPLSDMPVPSAPIPPENLVPGYMPLRGDFDVEYENDAENILADMEFSDDIRLTASATEPLGFSMESQYEHASEISLKLAVIDIYNRKLTEREKRKRFVIENMLVDVKRQQQVPNRSPRPHPSHACSWSASVPRKNAI